MRYPQAVSVFSFGLQQVLFRADIALKRHNDFFANRVDGRVRDLGETLLEVVIEHARLFAHHGQGRVVTHGTQWIAQFLDHGQQHELHGLLGITQGLHAWGQRDVVE